MEPVHKRPKLRVSKAAAEDQPAAQIAKIVQPDNYSSWRDEEELIDYEPEEPARFSPVEVDNSPKKMITRPTEMSRKTKYQLLMIFPLISRRLTIW